MYLLKLRIKTNTVNKKKQARIEENRQLKFIGTTKPTNTQRKKDVTNFRLQGGQNTELLPLL